MIWKRFWVRLRQLSGSPTSYRYAIWPTQDTRLTFGAQPIPDGCILLTSPILFRFVTTSGNIVAISISGDQTDGGGGLFDLFFLYLKLILY